MRVPAGDALAVDRVRFSESVLEQLDREPLINLERREVTELPYEPCIAAPGPLQAPHRRGIQRATGAGYLYFYDAIAPIVEGSTIDRSVAFSGSRYGKGGEDDYLNCP